MKWGDPTHQHVREIRHAAEISHEHASYFEMDGTVKKLLFVFVSYRPEDELKKSNLENSNQESSAVMNWFGWYTDNLPFFELKRKKKIVYIVTFNFLYRSFCFYFFIIVLKLAQRISYK